MKIIVFLGNIDYFVKLLSNHQGTLSPEILENISNFEGPSCLRKKRIVSHNFKFYVVHAFLVGNTFLSNARLKLAKNQSNAMQHPEVELLLLFTFFVHVIIKK